MGGPRDPRIRQVAVMGDIRRSRPSASLSGTGVRTSPPQRCYPGWFGRPRRPYPFGAVRAAVLMVAA
jgi:hypothetical protein